MANPHPTPRLENLRPPWQPGTSGNPAGYSQGRRISDAIENMIDELGLERVFAATAIAMALGHKHTLKQLVKDPVTGVDVWVEHKPDLKWFKMIVPQPRIEPAAQQMDAVTRLRTILQDIERRSVTPRPIKTKLLNLQSGRRVIPATSTNKLSQPARSSRTCQRTQAAARSRSRPPRRIFPPAIPARPWRWNDRPASAACRSCTVFSSSSIRPGMLSGSWRSLTAQLAGLSTGNIRGFLPGNIRIRPRLAGGLGRALAEIAVVACFLLFHQAVVLDDQRADGHVVQAGAGAADEQHGSQVGPPATTRAAAGSRYPGHGPLIPDQLARDLVAGEVVAGQAGAHPRTLVTRSRFPGFYPVLAPERPPDGTPSPTSKT